MNSDARSELARGREHADVVEHVVASATCAAVQPIAAVWNVGDTPSSTHRCHTGS